MCARAQCKVYSHGMGHSQSLKATALGKERHATEIKEICLRERHGWGVQSWVWSESGPVVWLTALHSPLSLAPFSLLPPVSQFIMVVTHSLQM